MPDDNPSGAGAGQGTPPAENPAGMTPPATPTIPPASQESFDAERAMATIRKQREVEQLLNKQLAEANARLKEKEDADLSELERLRKQATEAAADRAKAEAAARRAAARAEAHVIATRLHIVNPDDALTLLGYDKVTFDADHNPIGLEAQIAELVKTKPYLVLAAPPSPTPSPTNPPRAVGAPGDKPKIPYSKLSDFKFQNENRADIMLAAREGRIDFDA